MDSSFFLISNTSQANTSNPSSLNDLEQSSSSSSMFNYDPFDSFSILDQQGLRLYDFLGASVGGGGGGASVGATCDWAQGIHLHHSSSHNHSNHHNSHHHNHLHHHHNHHHHSPLIGSGHQHCPLLDSLDNLHQPHHQQTSLATSGSTSTSASTKGSHFTPHFPFQTDPSQQGEDGEEENHHHHHNSVDDDDDLHGALTSFVEDIGGVDSDPGYNSGEVELFPHANTTGATTCLTTSSVDCSDPTEAYYLRLALEQENCGNSNSSHEFTTTSSNNNYSDINNNNNNNYNSSSGNSYLSYNVTMSCNGDSNTSQTTATATKRSVLMNLLIDGSDVGAGYTSHNCRALPQARRQQNQQQLQSIQPQHPRPQY